MTRRNQQWHTITKLCDFDAVSLYPSAMKRLHLPLGKPKVLTAEQLDYNTI